MGESSTSANIGLMRRPRARNARRAHGHLHAQFAAPKSLADMDAHGERHP
jgi:hypothetical protein